MRLRPLIKGLLSFPLPRFRTTHQERPDSALSAEYCYSMFLRHFSYVSGVTGGRVPRIVAEFGPGSSLGMGLAALLAGAEVYYALDLVDHTDPALNLRVFDDLVALFHDASPIPSTGIHADNFPLPLDGGQAAGWAFPQSLRKTLPALMTPARLAALRQDLESRAGRFVRMGTPWHSRVVAPAPHSVDWIFSHAVLQHVDDIGDLCRASAEWMAPCGLATHEIDYTSHRLTRHQNGHWAIGDRIWTLIRGRRPYLLNRLPHSAQLRLLTDNGFVILREEFRMADDPLPKTAFAPRFRDIPDADAAIAEAFILCRAL